MTMGRNEYDRMNTGANEYPEALAAGADVYGSDNEKIGTVADVGENYFLVQKGWLFVKDLYLPTNAIARADGNDLYLNYTKHEAEQMGRDQLPAAGDTWYGTQRTTTRTTSTATPERTVDRTTDRTVDREVGRTANKGENISVPIVEEQLKAGVRETEGGHARIVRDVHEEQQTLDVPVEHEEVYVTERAVNRPATEADMKMRDRDIEIPLREQEVVTQKQSVVTGEVNVRKEVKRDTERVSGTVRHEDVHVEDPNNPHIHVKDDRGMMDRTGDRTANTMPRTDRMADGMADTPTDTAYDRTSMAGDRYETDRPNEGIMDRAKEKMRNDETTRNR